MKVPPSVRTIAPRGFSLIELLTVMAIIVILMVVAGPSISAISGSGTVNKAAADVQRTLELARLYAMSHQTYVRVGFSDIPDTTPGVPEGAIVILPVASADGTLSATNMAASNWPALARPMVLKTFELRGDIV